MTLTELPIAKALMEYLAAFGVPGAVVLLLLIGLRSGGGKPRDPAADLLESMKDLRAEVKEVRRGVDDMDSRLIRVETRQEMLLGQGEIRHWSDRTIPPR